MEKVDEILRKWVFQTKSRADNFIQRTFEVWKSTGDLPKDIFLGAKIFDYLRDRKGLQVTEQQKKKAFAAAKKSKSNETNQIALAKTECLIFQFQQLKQRNERV